MMLSTEKRTFMAQRGLILSHGERAESQLDGNPGTEQIEDFDSKDYKT
jgi:hypothetical protein